MYLMGEKGKLKRILIKVFLAFVLIFVLVNYIAFRNSSQEILQQQIQSWGYFGMFIFVFLLEAFPQPILSPLIPFSIGIILGFDFVFSFVVLLFATIFSNYFAYSIGKKYDRTIVSWFVSNSNYKISSNWFGRYGKIAFTILALTPLPYFPLLGGIYKMSLKDFTIYAVLPRIIYTIFYSSLIGVFV